MLSVFYKSHFAFGSYSLEGTLSGQNNSPDCLVFASSSSAPKSIGLRDLSCKPILLCFLFFTNHTSPLARILWKGLSADKTIHRIVLSSPRLHPHHVGTDESSVPIFVCTKISHTRRRSSFFAKRHVRVGYSPPHALITPLALYHLFAIAPAALICKSYNATRTT